MIIDKRTRDRLAGTTRFTDIREFERIDSTNTYLLAEAKAGAPEGVVATTDYQEAGRGRLGRVWTAPPGSSLLVSILLRPTGLPPGRRHVVTAAVSLAACSAVESVAGFAPALKWPNDLLVGNRKLAGTLTEAEGDAVIPGIGINVAAAPPEAVAVDEIAGRPVDRGELLAALLTELEGWYGHWDAVARAYREQCATVGQAVRVELPDHTVVGVASAIDDLGHLLVRSSADGELVEVTVGDVVHLRPAE